MKFLILKIIRNKILNKNYLDNNNKNIKMNFKLNNNRKKTVLKRKLKNLQEKDIYNTDTMILKIK